MYRNKIIESEKMAETGTLSWTGNDLIQNYFLDQLINLASLQYYKMRLLGEQRFYGISEIGISFIVLKRNYGDMAWLGLYCTACPRI